MYMNPKNVKPNLAIVMNCLENDRIRKNQVVLRWAQLLREYWVWLLPFARGAARGAGTRGSIYADEFSDSVRGF
jgi:hypothetical protein